MDPLKIFRNPADRVPPGTDGAPGIVDGSAPMSVVLPLEYPGQILFQPLVQPGDTVRENQVIGRSALGNTIHASISGTVREIRTVWSPRSFQVPAVVIDRGPGEPLGPQETLGQCDLDLEHASWTDLLRAGGVVSPWTTPGRNHGEENGDAYPPIRHLVIKGFNEEPALENFERLLVEDVDDVLECLRRMRELEPQAKPWVTVRRALVPWARTHFDGLAEVVGVPEKFKKRLERLVIPTITGIDLCPTRPFRADGVAVLSVEHALSLLAALGGRPFTRKTVTVGGAGVDVPFTVRVPLGTTVADILTGQGIDASICARVVMGGPMMGMAVFDLETPLTKFQHGVYLMRADDLPSERNLTCVNCGRCTRACPMGLQVHLMGLHVQHDLLPTAAEYHPEVCLECGLCAFVCPSHRPLVQLVRIAKRFGEVKP